MYAAHAATASGWVDLLRLLAADKHPNVAAIAIPGLSAAAGHAGDELYLNVLASNDGQLLMAAAAALTGGAQPVEQLLAALERVTALERETSRAPRRALLEAIGSLGSADKAEAVGAYLRDFDPIIAAAAADVLEHWTGRRPAPDPQPLPPSPFPSAEEIGEIEEIRAVVRMRGGGEFALRLYPFDAPSNTARFVRLARQGYFDGLTFHRVVPNFVIQGGEPRRQRVRRRRPLHARRDHRPLAPARHGRHLHARPRYRRRADLRQPDRQRAPRLRLHDLRRGDRGHGHGRGSPRRCADRYGAYRGHTLDEMRRPTS